jgi:hypothetical protein
MITVPLVSSDHNMSLRNTQHVGGYTRHEFPIKYHDTPSSSVLVNMLSTYGFAQSAFRQRLSKHVPTRNNGNCVTEEECYCSLLGNSQCTNKNPWLEMMCLVFSVVRVEALKGTVKVVCSQS